MHHGQSPLSAVWREAAGGTSLHARNAWRRLLRIAYLHAYASGSQSPVISEEKLRKVEAREFEIAERARIAAEIVALQSDTARIEASRQASRARIRGTEEKQRARDQAKERVRQLASARICKDIEQRKKRGWHKQGSFLKPTD